MTTVKEVVDFLIEKGIDFRIVNSAYPYGVIAIEGEVFTEVLRELINTFPVSFERDKDIMLYIPFDDLEIHLYNPVKGSFTPLDESDIEEANQE